ncbi:MAG: hypothetical protein M3328_03080 [Chloroflexota bacterium]|nr:hypothetical protein [Chloroflexota bacterium]
MRIAPWGGHVATIAQPSPGVVLRGLSAPRQGNRTTTTPSNFAKVGSYAGGANLVNVNKPTYPLMGGVYFALT